jgi:uncharacterized protein YceK
MKRFCAIVLALAVMLTMTLALTGCDNVECERCGKQVSSVNAKTVNDGENDGNKITICDDCVVDNSNS